MSNLVQKLLDKINQQHKHIIVIGDAIIDRWMYGTVEECQDGCPKFVHGSVTVTPGGAANAANCLRNWGEKVSLYGQTGAARAIKNRYVDDGKVVFRVDEECPVEHGFDYWWWISLEMIEHAGAVLLSDYDKGFLTPQFIGKVVNACARRGIICVADAKREPKTYDGCIIKGNELWFGMYYGSRPVVLSVESDNLVCTRGHLPPIIWGSEIDDNLPPVKCVNHVGAGDCFAAHLTLALAHGFSLRDAATIAHSAGRVYVQYPHNRPPTPVEVAADLERAS